MEPKNDQTIENSNRTKFLILYVVKNMSIPTETMISKICYLCDYLSVKNLGSPISNLEYENSVFGPQGKNIAECLFELARDGEVNQSIEYGVDGTEHVEYHIATNAQKLVEDSEEFSVGEKQIIDEVLRSVGSLNARLLTEVVDNTKPIKDVNSTNSSQKEKTYTKNEINLQAYAPRN